jgi:dephospho-CoA kinase
LWAEKYTDEEVVAFESATVLEKQQFNGFGDVVLLVNAPFALRLSRALERDKMDEGKVLSRMAYQPLMNRLSDGESDDRIDYVIQNDASASDLGEKLREFIEKYTLTKML